MSVSAWCAAAWTLGAVAAFADGGTASARLDRARGVRLPLHFEANAGQSDERVRFMGRGTGLGLFLTADEAVLVLPKAGSRAETADEDAAVVRMKTLGSKPPKAIVGAEPLPGVSNFLIGRDRSRWRQRVAQYARVEYRGVYPGVDLAFHGRQGQLEYDFIVAPGADPGAIRVRFDGASTLRIDKAGNLVIGTPAGELVQPVPSVYQEGADGRGAVRAGYVLEGGRDIAFRIGPYDPSRTLIIDPVLSYSTYFGGGRNDAAAQIALDAAGNIYVAGWTFSDNFPVVNAVQAQNRGDYDAFVSKLDPTGSTLLYSTYLGGIGMDLAIGLAVDPSGQAHLAGLTQSGDFPTLAAIQPQSGGGQDAFVAKLAADGSALVYSTYLGGTADDRADGVAADAAGNTYVAGTTLSTNFPTANPLQPAHAGEEDFFVARLSPSGSTLAYSTYLGGSSVDRGFGIAADAAGNAYVTGSTQSDDFPTVNPLQPVRAGRDDVLVAVVNPTGSALTFSTYLGGTHTEYLPSIVVDGASNIYVAGQTYSADFPTKDPLQAGKGGAYHGVGSDIFVTKILAGGSALGYSTYLGGEWGDFPGDLAVDSAGSVYLVGETESSRFPVLAPVQLRQGGRTDAFAVKLDPAGAALVYSTYLGGSDATTIDAAESVAVDALGTMHVAGRTNATDFPVVTPFQGFNAGLVDGFVASIAATSIPRALAVDGQASPASNGNGVLEPGETVTASPSWFNDRTQPVTAAGAASDITGPAGATYTIVDGAADYGSLPPATAGSCAATGDCYSFAVSNPPVRPEEHWDAVVTEELAGTSESTRWRLHVGGTFEDVPQSSPFYRFVETLVHKGVTSGCAPGAYCPAAPVTREQMAVFVLSGREWPLYSPFGCGSTSPTFADVPASSAFCRWIEELARRAVVTGCGGGNFCPTAPVTREQMPVFVLAALEGRGYRPAACGTPLFADVPAVSPFCPWIEELARRGVVAGCGDGNYCPLAPVSRDQMAVFVSAAFGLNLYGP